MSELLDSFGATLYVIVGVVALICAAVVAVYWLLAAANGVCDIIFMLIAHVRYLRTRKTMPTKGQVWRMTFSDGTRGLVFIDAVTDSLVEYSRANEFVLEHCAEPIKDWVSTNKRCHRYLTGYRLTND